MYAHTHTNTHLGAEQQWQCGIYIYIYTNHRPRQQPLMPSWGIWGRVSVLDTQSFAAIMCPKIKLKDNNTN